MPADEIHVADLLQSRIGDDDGRARRELAQVVDRVLIEINMIGNTEPHRRFHSPRDALDIDVVINVDVIHGAVAAAGAASEGERGHHVVVNAAQGTDRSRRIHDDAPGIDHLAVLGDDLIVRREDDRRVPQPAKRDSRRRTP